MHKVDYINEAQVFKNNSMQIDSYVVHHSLSDWLLCLTVRSIRRVLKNSFNIIIDLVDTVSQVKAKHMQMTKFVIDHILAEENYLGKTILPIEIFPPEVVKQIDDTNNQPDNNTINNNPD